jgi:hypothetical protein
MLAAGKAFVFPFLNPPEDFVLKNKDKIQSVVLSKKAIKIRIFAKRQLSRPHQGGKLKNGMESKANLLMRKAQLVSE